MIGSLTGTITERSTEFVLLDVRGVGYLVYCSERTLAGLPPEGTAARLYTDLLVRDDLLQLFGFHTKKERELHRLLISVQGVGAKAALAIVGALGSNETIQAVTLGDSDSIRTAKGVGPKLAIRIVNELKEKMAALIAWSEHEAELPTIADNESVSTMKVKTGQKKRLARSNASAEAHSALVNLGYQQGEAARAIAEAVREQAEANTEELIRKSLLQLIPK